MSTQNSCHRSWTLIKNSCYGMRRYLYFDWTHGPVTRKTAAQRKEGGWTSTEHSFPFVQYPSSLVREEFSNSMSMSSQYSPISCQWSHKFLKSSVDIMGSMDTAKWSPDLQAQGWTFKERWTKEHNELGQMERGLHFCLCCTKVLPLSQKDAPFTGM